jgi:hypothetical protein
MGVFVRTGLSWFVVVATAVAGLSADPAFAQKRPKDPEPKSIRAKCFKEAGAYYIPELRVWRITGGIGNAQMQQVYNCIDSYTMKRR